MPHHRDLETQIENKFCLNISNWARQHNIVVVPLKLNLQGRRGWPDRLILWEGGNFLFIEFKRPGEAPRKLQLYIHQLLRDIGFEVQVHDDADIALRDVQAKIRATTPADEKYVVGSTGSRLQAFLEARAREDSGSS